MMGHGFTSVNDIAASCGYSDAQYFSKIFKSKMGISPSRYIRDLQTEKTR
jgi:YesN/AraC family two-component response regulator